MLLGGFEIPLWVVLGVPTVTLMYLYSTRTFQTFKKSGIPGPKPYPLVGNGLDLYKDNMMNIDMKLRAEYGKFVGVFEGTTPVLMVYDGIWLKEAFIKNFSKFTKRRDIPLGGTIDDSLAFIAGDHWKFVRKMLSPEFASGKLKRLMPAIQQCDDRFVEVLRKEAGQPVDIRRKTNLLTLDVISKTAFGFDAETQIREDAEFTKMSFGLGGQVEATSTLLEKIRSAIIMLFLFVAPPIVTRLASQVFNISVVNLKCESYFYQLCENVLKERKQSSSRGNDFLQILADNVVDETKMPPLVKDEQGKKWTHEGLTKREVIGNAILFLVAGFETTADTLLFIFYELAMHPDVQKKLYEEIMSVCDTEEITNEQLNELKYLDRCINETMRLFPQGFRFDREASEDVTINGIFIEKGTAVTASSWAIHRDPEVWGEDPEDFNPDRFLPERMTEEMQASFIPFGIGNRQCIGSRLALIEMKMTLITTLKAFSVERNKETPAKPIKFKAVFALSPEKTIKVTFKERN